MTFQIITAQIVKFWNILVYLFLKMALIKLKHVSSLINFISIIYLYYYNYLQSQQDCLLFLSYGGTSVGHGLKKNDLLKRKRQWEISTNRQFYLHIFMIIVSNLQTTSHLLKFELQQKLQRQICRIFFKYQNANIAHSRQSYFTFIENSSGSL